MLGVFKYTDFFLENFNLFTQLLHLDFAIPLPHILLPLALSFVTFQQIAFLVDCYKQSKEREKAQRLESNVKNNRESQHSLTQTTLSTTTAKEKRFIPSPLPLAQKSKATAFLFCNQGESLAISASSIKSAGDTTAPFKSDFMHHEAGESRNERKACNIDCMDFANAKYQKPTLDSNNAESNKDIPHINFLDYCLFITFFPQLIAGPIVHHKEMMPQFYAMSRNSKICDKDLESRQLVGDSKIVDEKTRQSRSFFSKCGLQAKAQESCLKGNDRRAFVQLPHLSLQTESLKKPSIINWEHIAKGLFIFSIGLFKKVVIADSFAKWANAGSKAIESGQMLNFFESWATALSHMFEYYFDFSGYCDMAIGLGLLFGIILPVNFNSPFKSLSISEFWRRWHITLGRFLKYYVYIPLGGSRVSLIFNLRNLFLVFLISGLWHGAGFGFIIWGSIHGLSVVIHKLYTLFYKRLDSASLYMRFMKTKSYIVLCWLLTFMVVLLARVFYISPSVKDAFVLLKGMFFGDIVLPSFLESRLGFLGEYGLTFGAWLEQIQGSFITPLWILGAFIMCLGFKNSVEYTNSISYTRKMAVLTGLLLTFCILYFQQDSAFLYFNF